MINNTLNESYKYNGDGTRIRKQTSSAIVNYHYNKGSLYYTTDGVNQVINENIRSLGGKMISTIYNNEFYNYLIDIRGSTSEIVDSNGEFNTFYRYSAFGETEVEVNPLTNPVNNEICYTGAIHDENTGLYYMNARYYDSANGRFVSQDSYRGSRDDYRSLHLYAYCSNDPVNNTDPSGHAPSAGDGDFIGNIKDYWFHAPAESKAVTHKYHCKCGGSHTGSSHTGVDIPIKVDRKKNNERRKSVYVVQSGIIKQYWSNVTGYTIELAANNNVYVYRYYHLLKSGLASNKSRVTVGKVIGKIGNTGSSSKGEHLHFEVLYNKNHSNNNEDSFKRIDPRSLLRPMGYKLAEKDWNSVEAQKKWNK